MTLVRCTNLQKAYEGRKIEFPDISLESKDNMLVLGPSGSGKSTLLSMMAGLLSPTQGTVEWEESDIYQWPSKDIDDYRGKNLGMIFQKSYFIPSLNVQDNILLSPHADIRLLNDLAAKLNIKDLLRKKPSRLSIGEQQRIGIARALICKPKILLADEPTSALDNANCQNVISLIKEASSQLETALIIVTHDERLTQHFDHKIHLQ